MYCGPGSSVGMATELRAGRSGDRIPVRGDIFRTCPDRPWGPPSHLYNGYRVFTGGKELPGRDADPSPPSSAVGNERVELYIYSPYGPYGLCWASVPVQGCTLSFLRNVVYMMLINAIRSRHELQQTNTRPTAIKQFEHHIWKAADYIYRATPVLSTNRT